MCEDCREDEYQEYLQIGLVSKWGSVQLETKRYQRE